MTSSNRIYYFISCLFLPFLVYSAEEATKCEICQDITKAFKKGLANTNNGNFGGGNTDWEEKRLGNYANSETRLISIIENLCKNSKNDKKCHAMVEENEETIEKWWFSTFKTDPNSDLHDQLCIRTLQICCPSNHYGDQCVLCKGVKKDKACLGHGECSGNGTRSGDGSCNCDEGYSGDICDECSEEFYYTNLNGDFECKRCHVGCSGGCSGEGPLKCESCAAGWTMDASKGCTDINECLENEGYGSCSKDSEYCENSDGSYNCLTCDPACSGCVGGGSTKCTSCNAGYELSGKTCQDINECSADSTLCRDSNERCENTPGSYRCGCVTGFERNSNNACVKVPSDKEKVKSVTNSESGDDDDDDPRDEL